MLPGCGDVPRWLRGGSGVEGRSCAGLPRRASDRPIALSFAGKRRQVKSKPGAACFSFFSGIKGDSFSFSRFLPLRFRGALVTRSLFSAFGQSRGTRDVLARKGGSFAAEQREGEGKRGKSRWPSLLTTHCFFSSTSTSTEDFTLFALLFSHRSCTTHSTLTFSPPHLFFHPQLLIKGIRSFSPDNEVNEASFGFRFRFLFLLFLFGGLERLWQ